MVHKAIELWLFPGDSRLIPMLEAAALDAGLASSEERIEAIRRVRELLERFRQHPLWEEINSASERYHEIPYSRLSENRPETGYMDVLYHTSGGWQVVDFKTDSIRSDRERDHLAAGYAKQMRRYASAVQALLGQPAEIRICFLDDNGKVVVVPT